MEFLHKVGGNDEIDVLVGEGIKVYLIHCLKETILEGVLYVIKIK